MTSFVNGCMHSGVLMNATRKQSESDEFRRVILSQIRAIFGSSKFQNLFTTEMIEDPKAILVLEENHVKTTIFDRVTIMKIKVFASNLKTHWKPRQAASRKARKSKAKFKGILRVRIFFWVERH